MFDTKNWSTFIAKNSQAVKKGVGNEVWKYIDLYKCPQYDINPNKDLLIWLQVGVDVFDRHGLCLAFIKRCL